MDEKFYVRRKIENFEELKKDKLAGEYKKKHISFTYYTEKYLNEQRKDDKEVKIVGNVSLSELKKKKQKEKDDEIFLLLDDTCKHNEELKYYLTKKTKKHDTVGYFEVNDGEYIRISKKNGLFFLLLLILLCIFFGFIMQSVSPDPDQPDSEGVDSPDVVSNGAVSKAGYGQIEIAGYAELSVDSKNQTIQLVNPNSNDVYFKYIIKKAGTDKVVFESKLIEPGKAFLWNAKKALKVGKHKLDFCIQTFDIKTKANCQGATNRNVEVVVK